MLLLLPHLLPGQESPKKSSPPASTPTALRDGKHDFDFELGSWKIHLKRRLKPLTGSNEWAEFDGTSVTRKVWDGKAEIEEFVTDGPSGHIEGLTLRLYNPESHQWSLYWSNSKVGTIGGPPNVGEFRNGLGEFYCQDTFNGRTIMIRYAWSDIATTAHFRCKGSRFPMTAARPGRSIGSRIKFAREKRIDCFFAPGVVFWCSEKPHSLSPRRKSGGGVRGISISKSAPGRPISSAYFIR